MATLLSYALTTKADVKESLGLSSGDTSKDNLIIRNINKATRAIERYCGDRRFLSTVYTNEEYVATGTDQLILRQRPVTTLTSLDIRDSSLNYDNWETIDTKLYYCAAGSAQANAGVVDLMFKALGKWNRYRVTYTAGYSTIPEDLAEACAVLAAYYTVNPDGKDVGVQEYQEGARRVRYLKNSITFRTILENLGIDEIIDSYSNNPIMLDR